MSPGNDGPVVLENVPALVGLVALAAATAATAGATAELERGGAHLAVQLGVVNGDRGPLGQVSSMVVEGTELAANPRASSGRLRAAVKTGGEE